MYEIADYDKLYRPYDKSGGELKHPDFVKLPVKPTGEGLQELLEYRRGLEIFGIWCLLLEKTTAEKKPENRGKLLNHRELPATPYEIAKGISLKKKGKLVSYALSVLSTIGWLNSEETSEDFRKLPPNITKDKLTKDNLTKVKKSKEYTLEFENFWNKFKGRYDPENDRYIKVGKWEAFLEWEKLLPEQRKKADVVANKVRGKFTPDACRWLKRRMFDDFTIRR